MKFDEFLSSLPKINNLPLPGKEAHFAMAPIARVKQLKAIDIEKLKPRKAAVMMLCYPKQEQTHFVLILRKTYKGVHSNQVGFPGGKVEPEDASLLDTALRETEEEIGIARDTITAIKKLTNIYIPPSNFYVQSFIGYLDVNPKFVLQPDEVAAILEVPLQELLDQDATATATVATTYAANLEVPVFTLNEHTVWGATAMMLNEVRELFYNLS